MPIEALLAEREWVRGLARSLVGDESRAADLEQDAWVAALERPPAHRASIRGWLATVLRRGAARGRRTAVRLERRERAAARPEAEPSAAQVVEQAELHALVVRAVLDLQEPYRATILLRYFEGLPRRGIAARMAVPVETVGARLQRGLALLRERLDREHGGERRAWAAGLIALANGRPGGFATGTPVPALALAVACTLLVVAGGLWLGHGSDRGGEPGRAVVDLSSRTSPPSPSLPGDGATLGARPADGGRAPQSNARRASLSGRVTRGDAAGRAVAGARVVAMWTTPYAKQVVGPTVREAISSDDGRYAIDDLGAGDVLVVAYSAGLATVGLAGSSVEGWNPLVVSLRPGMNASLDLVLVPAATLSGRARNSEGRPVAGATIRVGPAPSPRGGFSGLSLTLPTVPPWRTTTAADGTFTVSDVPIGATYELGAEADGMHPPGVLRIEVTGRVVEGIEVRFPESRWIDVQVVDAEGRVPIPGARVNAMEKTDALTSRGVPHAVPWTTGTDGRVRVGPCLPVSVSLVAEATGFAPSGPKPGWIEVASDAGACVILLRHSTQPSAEARSQADLEEKGTRLRVLGPDGEPVPFGTAVAWKADNSQVSGGGGFYRDGAMNLGWASPPSEFCEVFGARDAQGVPLPYAAARVPHGGVRDIEVRLGPEKEIEGTVVDPAGRGISGALLLAQPMWWPEGPTVFAELAHATTRTDAKGAFRLAGLADTAYRLVVRAPPGFVGGPEHGVAAGSRGVVVHLHATAASTPLRFLDSGGVPIAGVRVDVLPAGTDPRDRDRVAMCMELPPQVVSDRTGSAVLGSLDPAATYALVVVPPESRPDLEQFVMDPWSPKEQTFTLGITRVLRGRIQDFATRGLQGVEVLCTTVSGGGRSVPVSADGSFVLQKVPAGDLLLVPYFRERPVTGQSRQAQRIPAGTEFAELAFDPGLSLVVRVENAEGKSMRAQLVLDDSAGGSLGAGGRERGGGGGPGYPAERDDSSDGTLRFRGLEAGQTYTLCISPVGTSSLIRSGIRAESGEIHVRLEPGLRITGRILVPDGATRLQVGLNDGRISANGAVDAEGRFTIDGLPEGTYEVSAWARLDGSPLSGRATLRAGDTGDIDLRPR